MKSAAIVLAGGSGSRMKSKTKKQYLLLGDHSVLWYSLNVFQKSSLIDEIVLVCGAGEKELCRSQYVEDYGFSKIRRITEGGRERYHSVYQGLKQLEDCDYVLIHDGARPFIDEAMLERIFKCLSVCPACAVGMPVKDTIKMRDAQGYVEQTLPREKLWITQTPQAFSYALIRQSYDKLMRLERENLEQAYNERMRLERENLEQAYDERMRLERENSEQTYDELVCPEQEEPKQADDGQCPFASKKSTNLCEDRSGTEKESVDSVQTNAKRSMVKITDDAMVVETFSGVPIKLIEGSYDNIKITTPEDLPLAMALLGSHL